jgi:uncharacterized membrane protein HdeD (DUF308 family)
MQDSSSAESAPSRRRTAFWVTLARSILALTLGAALILHPDKARPVLVNFIGVFWVAGGLMSLRWGATGDRARRPSVIIGVIGVVAGVVVLGRFVLMQFIGESPIVLLLGAVVVLTGLVHIFEGLRTGPTHQRQRSLMSSILGLLEVVLGLVILVWRDEFGSLFYAIVVAWAFLGALVLMREAWRQRPS